MDSKTVAEYKNYMSNPHKTRRRFIRWRQIQIKNLLQGKPELTKEQAEQMRLESEFLNTLDFYNGIKDQILSPLVSMQVRLWNL